MFLFLWFSLKVRMNNWSNWSLIDLNLNVAFTLYHAKKEFLIMIETKLLLRIVNPRRHEWGVILRGGGGGGGGGKREGK